jgi:hypothetical protein
METDYKPYLLSVSGGAGLFAFGLGAINQVKSYIQSVKPDAVIHYAGVSSGAIVAFMGCLGIPEKDIPTLFARFDSFFDNSLKTVYTYWYPAVRKFCLSLLPDKDDYKKCNGNLFIGYSTFNGLRFTPKVVSEFTSNEDLVESLIASSTLFPISWTPFRLYRGQFCSDGGFTCNQIALPDHINVPLSYSYFQRCFKTKLKYMLLSTCQRRFEYLFRLGKDITSSLECSYLCQIKEKPEIRPVSRSFANYLYWAFLGLCVYYLTRVRKTLSP